MAKQALEIAPFPVLQWDDYSWTGEFALPFWSGFQSRRGAYGAINSHDSSTNMLRLSVVSEDDELQAPPLPEQVLAFSSLLENESIVGNSVLQAIFSAYPGLRKSYGYKAKEADELMPAIRKAEQLRQLIGISYVHILTIAKEGIAYIGFEFGCTWDSEHGLGVMTHRDRIVKIGGADTSFLEWIAEDDTEA